MAYLSRIPAWPWVEPGSMKTQLELWEIYLPQQSNASKAGSKAAQLQQMPHFVQQGAQASQPRRQRQTSRPLDTLSPPAQRDAPGTQSQPVPSSPTGPAGPRVTSAEPPGARASRSTAQWISRDAARGAETRFRALPKESSSHPNHGMLLWGSGGKDLPLTISQAQEAQRPPVR